VEIEIDSNFHGEEIVAKGGELSTIFLKLQTKKLQISLAQISPQNAHVNASNLHLQPKGGARLVNATLLHL
jgi:hypothetical protein